MTGITMAKRLERLRDRGGMMPKVVNHRYAPRFAANFLPARDSQKTGERLVDLRFGHAIKTRGTRGHGGVAHIELADQRNFKGIVAEREPRSIGGISDVANSLRAVFGKADLDHLRAAILADFHAVRIVAVQQHHAVLRHDVEQTPEAQFDLDRKSTRLNS